MRTFEEDLKAKYRRSIICSKTDREWLGIDTDNCKIVPNLVDTDFFYFSNLSNVRKNTVAFVGNMKYPPNHDAIRYFVERVWPLITEHLPDAKLLVIGDCSRKLTKELSDVKNIVITGYVEDIRQYLKEAALFVAPIRMGSGVNFKVLQALSMGIPVVCSTVANDGIFGNEEAGIFVEDDPQNFAERVVEISTKYDEYNECRKEARNFIVREYSRLANTERLLQAFQSFN
jgi:glycosyltransferase involved in cell wall biosynthesis